MVKPRAAFSGGKQMCKPSIHPSPASPPVLCLCWGHNPSPGSQGLFTKSCIPHNSSSSAIPAVSTGKTNCPDSHWVSIQQQMPGDFSLGLLHTQKLLSQEKGEGFIYLLAEALTLCLQFFLLNKAQQQHLLLKTLGFVSAGQEHYITALFTPNCITAPFTPNYMTVPFTFSRDVWKSYSDRSF